MNWHPEWLYDPDHWMWDDLKLYRHFDAGDRMPTEFGDANFGCSCTTFIFNERLQILPDLTTEVAISCGAPESCVIFVVTSLDSVDIYGGNKIIG